jgi:hypothetical protein
MKKFILILLAVCLLLGCVVGYLVSKNGPGGLGEPVALYDPENVAPAQDGKAETAAAPAASAETPADGAAEGSEETEAAVSTEFRGLDYEAIRALHEPDEIVGNVNGRSVTWDEYFYWLHDIGTQAEQYVQTLALYGQSLDWNDKLSSDSDVTLAEYVVQMAKDCVRQLNVVEAVAEENEVTLTEENEKELSGQLQETIVNVCGDGASEEDFNARLEEELVSRDMYDRISRANYLFQNSFDAIYGENGEKVPEETAMAFLQEREYLDAAHILFMTIDPNTMEPLDEASVAKKLQQAEAVSEELRSIEDVDARVARFAELKEQYCEDTGKTAYPDGYLFTPGTMVAEFEEGVKALAEYEVSEPILSAWGYHVIMRLPLSTEMTMDYSQAGTPLDARAVYANEEFNTMMNERIETSVFTIGEDFAIDLTDYLK